MKTKLLKQINAVEMLQRMYDSEITFSLSSDCFDGGFTIKVGARDSYGGKWAKTETVDGVEFALARLLDMVLAHYPGSKFAIDIEGVTIVYGMGEKA